MSHVPQSLAMPVYIERVGDPSSRQLVWVCLHDDISHVQADGWMFSRVVTRQSAFGGIYVDHEIKPAVAQ